MRTQLADACLIYLGPRRRAGGVGDYAEQFVDAVRPLFGNVVEYRHAGPGDDTAADLRRHRAALKRLVQQAEPRRTVIHTELSGGAVAPFWAVAGLQGPPVTATVHDPPHLVWWPGRTKFMAAHRLLNHSIHYPLQPLSHRIQRAVAGERTLFALTESGVQSLRAIYPRARSVRAPHLVPLRPETKPVKERPRAVGFFGLVYRGKGFEQIAAIRRLLPKDIAIRVAGRGTESLPATPGIEVLGGVDGAEEDAFFGSVRAIVMPYGRRTFYGDAYPSSAVVAHAVGYRTPVICSDHGSLRDLSDQCGVVVLSAQSDTAHSARAFAEAIIDLVDDGPKLDTLEAAVEAERRARAPQRVADVFGAEWSRLLGHTQ